MRFFVSIFSKFNGNFGPQKGSFLPNIYLSGMSHFLYHLILNVNIVLSLQQAKHSHLCSGGSSRAGLEFGVPQTLAMASARPGDPVVGGKLFRASQNFIP